MTTVAYENFAQLTLQVGEITDVQDFKRARSPAYKVEVDLGEGERRWSSAQITNYSKEALLGRQVICISNLPERNIAGFMSQVLILGVPDDEGNTILLTPEQAVSKGVEVF